MKKVIAIGVIAAFLCAAMPRLADAQHHHGHHGHGGANPAALGIVAIVIVALVGLPAYIFGKVRAKEVEEVEKTNRLAIKGQVPLNAPSAFNGEPGEVEWDTGETKKPVRLTYKKTAVQPISIPASYKPNGGEGNAIYQAGAEAARENRDFGWYCRDRTDDFCRGFLADKTIGGR